jgi:syntaxin 8
MSNPNALLLLADHIKLSLLEQQRAKTLNLSGDSQDGHISRSLDQFREGLEALEKELRRLQEAGDESYCSPCSTPSQPISLLSN